jgi:hypothetical protein
MKNDLPKFKITIDDMYSDGEDLGIDKIAHTATPAIKKKGFAFNEVKQVKSVFADDLKYRISGPIMKRMDIYRRDNGEEYYVEFEKEVIDQLFVKFMSKLNNDRKNFNDEHEDKDAPSFLLYAWEEEDGDEIWITTQFTDKDVYNEYVEAGKTGYSIEGFLGMKMSEILEKQTKNKQQTMNQKGLKLGELGPSAYLELPVGEHTIGGKLYTVAEEVINPGTENEYTCNYIVSMVPVSGEETAPVADETQLSEETKLAEQTEEEKAAEQAAEEEDTKETEMAEGDVPTEETPAEENQVESYTKEEIDNKFDELYRVIADLKADESEEVKPVQNNETKLSIHDRFAELVRFTKENKVQL